MKRLPLLAILGLACLLLPAESQAMARSTPLAQLADSALSDSPQPVDHVLVVVVTPDGCYGAICRNDPVNGWDALGLEWDVQRKGGARAIAVAGEGDTIEQLARKVGLDPNEYATLNDAGNPSGGRWLQTVQGGPRLPINPNVPLPAGTTFSIPNTVRITFGDLRPPLLADVRDFCVWQMEDLKKVYEGEGYNVLPGKLGPGLTGDRFKDICTALSDPNIAVWAHAGHGFTVERSHGTIWVGTIELREEDRKTGRASYKYKWEGDIYEADRNGYGGHGPEAFAPSLPYKLQRVIMYACGGAGTARGAETEPIWLSLVARGSGASYFQGHAIDIKPTKAVVPRESAYGATEIRWSEMKKYK